MTKLVVICIVVFSVLSGGTCVPPNPPIGSRLVHGHATLCRLHGNNAGARQVELWHIYVDTRGQEKKEKTEEK